MNQSRAHFWIYGLFAALALFGVARLYYWLTDDFRLGNITHQMDSIDQWKSPALTALQKDHLVQVLNQKFYYIGKGAQCYAFASEDQQYVLKFFKFKHLRPNFFVQLLPPIPPFSWYKESVIEKKKKKLEGVFEGYDLAYKENQQESELLYLHLAPSHDLKQIVTVVDKIGLEKKINLDDVVFLVQRKGETLRTRLNRELTAGQVEAAKQSIAAILDMYLKEYRKGLYDRDHGVMHNTGFIENQPFHLDVGKFSKEVRMQSVDFYKKDLEHVVWKIDVWVKHHYPHYYANLSAYLTDQYYQHTGDLVDVAAIDPVRFKKKRHAFN